MEKLIIRNFGAIRDVEIELKALTIFIGETGTGKSTLAKLISIFRSRDFWSNEKIREISFFKERLTYYQIENFLEKESYIEYHSKIGISFVCQEGKILQSFSDELVKYLEVQFKELRKESLASHIEDITLSSFEEVIYIPADRGVVSFLAEKYAAIDQQKLTGIFPETLRTFTGYFNRISFILKKHYVELFDVTYQKINGKDYVELPNGKVLLLSETASGMQAAIPVILVLEHFSQFEREQKKSYTIEEPELNLFPSAQKTLVEFFAEKVLGCGHDLVITTHSPYILTATNNLVAGKDAYEHAQGNAEKLETLEKVLPSSKLIRFEDVSAYMLKDGNLETIMNWENRLIGANLLDSVSDEFDAIFGVALDILYGDD